MQPVSAAVESTWSETRASMKFVVFSVHPLCSLCLCGGFSHRILNHRDTENTEVAQRRSLSNCALASSCCLSAHSDLCVLCVSVVVFPIEFLTTETQRTQRLHREEAFQTARWRAVVV